MLATGIEFNYLRHYFRPQISICILPSRPMLYDFNCARCLEFRDHHRLGGKRNSDRAGNTKGARCMYSSKPSITTTGSENVRFAS